MLPEAGLIPMAAGGMITAMVPMRRVSISMATGWVRMVGMTVHGMVAGSITPRAGGSSRVAGIQLATGLRLTANGTISSLLVTWLSIS